MKGVLCAVFLLFAAASTLFGSTQPTRALTFEDRVQAQEAIELVYYSHQLGTTKPFEEAVPRSLMVHKVRTYLQESEALRLFWHTTISTEALERELRRMAERSKMPERLGELYDALDRDPVLILECLVRPVLVERLSHAFFSTDKRMQGSIRLRAEQVREAFIMHTADPMAENPRRTVLDTVNEHETSMRPGDVGPVVDEPGRFSIRVALESDPGHVGFADFGFPKISWDEWWSEAAETLEAANVSATDGPHLALPSLRAGMPAGQGAASLTCGPDDVWDAELLPSLQRSNHTAVWTGSEMIIWGGMDGASIQRVNSGVRYDPATDTWRTMSGVDAPSPRDWHGAVWTGSRMLIWGGLYGESLPSLNDGGIYDPVADSWTPITSVGAPQNAINPRLVWTGSHLLVSVWDATAAGGSYDPSTNSWTQITLSGAPSFRFNHTVVWTGTRMIVWGGEDFSGFLGDGGSYDPGSNTWTPLPVQPGTPQPRSNHSAVWTGNKMVVWGGKNGVNLNDGATFVPFTNTWTAMPSANAPAPRSGNTAVWTGTHMIVWGGGVDTGARFDPAQNLWSPTTTVNAPSPRSGHSAIWCDNFMIIWGGGIVDFDYPGTGGRYDPLTNSWTPTAVRNAPPGRTHHSTVWTGSLMLVYGGADNSPTYLNSGGRYDPAIDAWSSIPAFDGVFGRAFHTGVWAGDRMLVWGGQYRVNSSIVRLNSGGQYFLASNTWAPMTTTNAPSARDGHTAVWTGTQMIVWGGGNLSSGGQYDPVVDTWSPTATTNAPGGRSAHTAIWDGSRMTIWGGTTATSTLNTGGTYDPVSGIWTPTSQSNAPTARSLHTAVWTGTRMIVWGGYTGSGGGALNTGAQFDPQSGAWSPITTVAAPAARLSHTAVWAGSRMIIWGGEAGGKLNTGGRYYPAVDLWLPTAALNSPQERRDHSAIWTGSSMIIWGGSYGYATNSTGIYRADQSTDADLDGFGVCGGDCDDNDATAYPRASQVCDGKNNDCYSPTWPSTAGTNEVDLDGDGFSECQGDCDEVHASVFPGSTQVCGDGLDNDCLDPNWPAAAQVGDVDDDGDGFRICQDDCNDNNRRTYPGALEARDFEDNQCPGDQGYGVTDEISGDSGFFNSLNPSRYCWPSQFLANTYAVLRADDSIFLHSCRHFLMGDVSCWDDSDRPLQGKSYFYLVRSGGSWGQHSNGSEILPLCQLWACGDGVRETGEACDAQDFGGLTCQSFGFNAGALQCNSSCSIDSSLCFTITTNCGNGVIDTGEVCDGNDLGGETCVSQGFESGTLKCSSTCTALDASECRQ